MIKLLALGLVLILGANSSFIPSIIGQVPSILSYSVKPANHSTLRRTQTSSRDALSAQFKLNSNEVDAIAFLDKYNREYGVLLNEYVIASWNYETNITIENAAILGEVGGRVGEYSDQAFIEASQFDTTNFTFDTKRQLALVGSQSLSNEEMNELYDIQNQMGSIYASYQACRPDPTTGEEECLSLEPELTDLMAMNGNYEDHLWAWTTWHNGVGRQMRPLYIRYVQLKNKLAQLLGYTDYGDQWRRKYETNELESIVGNLYAQVEPLYKQLHAYIRRQLYNTYGAEYIDLRGPLPAHLLSDMWGRFWINLNEIAQPYPEKPSVDPSPEMIRQNYTIRRMFEMGNEFYTSMGLKAVPDTFWNRSMLEKPTDREVACHATAWDFYDGKDYRIRMCTRITFEDFLTVHHELGHIQYFQQYSNQPLGYRDGANDGFHEAVGELMAMSVATTKHLSTIGLLNITGEDPDVDMNFLLQQALNTLSTLPFHLVQDEFRWKIFRGDVAEADWNDVYWADKLRVVGVAPPVARDPALDLDVAAIFHVANDYDMIRYYMRTFFQYQFAEVLCNASGHQGPLYKCDFYQSTAAGDALAKLLQLGSSLPWQDAMEAMTGQRDVLATPLLNYFEPLRVWLEAKNAENGDFVGWETTMQSNKLHIDRRSAAVLAPLMRKALESLKNIQV